MDPANAIAARMHGPPGEAAIPGPVFVVLCARPEVAVQPVGAGDVSTANENITLTPALQSVISIATMQQIPAAAAPQQILQGTLVDHVPPVGAGGRTQFDEVTGRL